MEPAVLLVLHITTPAKQQGDYSNSLHGTLCMILAVA